MLKLDSVSKNYLQGKNQIEVLNQVNLVVNPGESVAIMGRSGSGKSTLLSLISGILPADKGEISLLGKSYGPLSESDLSDLRASQIGFIFQNFHLISYLDALENVMLAFQVKGLNKNKSDAIDLLKQVGLGKRLEHLPHQLSGGEKQRVALARAIIHEPSLILADEPSGSLDENTGEEVMDLLFRLVDQTGSGLILVTHAHNVAQRCQRLLKLEGKTLKNA